MFFAFAYKAAGEFGSVPFFGAAGHGTLSQDLFSSFVTMTTVGYGNLVPSANPGQTFAVICWGHRPRDHRRGHRPARRADRPGPPHHLARHLARIRRGGASGSLIMVLPGSFIHVLGGTDLLLLALAGLAIAVAGALGPASWAARTRTSAVLHTE
jgi:Ion channel